MAATSSSSSKRKRYSAAVNFYVTDAQKKKIECIMAQKGQNLTDFLRSYIQTYIEKYEEKNGTINVYQTFIE
jgi:hypothetical protein